MDSGAPPSRLPVLRRLGRLEAQFLRPHRWTVALALAGMLAQSVLLLPIPLLQGWVIDKLVVLFEQSRTLPSADAGAIARRILVALAASVACHVVRMGLSWKVSATISRVSLEVVRGLTDAMHRKLQRLPVAYYDREQTGRLMARITGDVGSLLIFLNTASLQLASDLVLAVGIVGTLLWLHGPLALVSFLAVPLYVFNHRAFAGRLRELSRAVRSHLAGLYGLLSERVSAVRVVRSFAQEETEVAELDGRIDAHRELGWAHLRLGALQAAAAILITGAGTVAVLMYGAALVRRGELSVGELLAFYTLLAQFYNPIVRLTQFAGTAAATQVAVDRIIEVLDEPETLADRPDARPVREPQGALAFRDVSFSYRSGGPLVLRGVDLKIEPGRTVALLGPSGAGKSTLLALAPRLYEVPEGRGAVLLDGHDVRGVRLADLRRAVALVPQQAMLFEGTIRSNLTYARPGASAEEIRRALEVADLAEMVEALPRGLETPVGERGFSLSGGQRQRLALARALIADPAVLLLDDCTSALDAETEARLFDALEASRPGRTTVVVTHKVSSVRRADWVVLLQAGRVVEQGLPQKLLAQDSVYRDLVEREARVLFV